MRQLATAAARVPAAQAAQAASYDICAVGRLDPNGDSFLALRAGPSSDSRMIVRLPPDTRLAGVRHVGRWMEASVLPEWKLEGCVYEGYTCLVSDHRAGRQGAGLRRPSPAMSSAGGEERMDMTARRVRVTGRVQGVGFRAWTVGRAQALGLRGWVRNEADGSVAALLAGPEAQVLAMIAALRQGPPSARVRDVVAEDAAPPPAPGFRVVS